MEAGRNCVTSELDPHHRSHRNIRARLLYHVARWAQRRSAVHKPADLERTTDEGHYRTWRYNELKLQLTRNFDVDAIRNLSVLDFGCGTGELCALLSRYSPGSLVGVDKSADAISRAEAFARDNPLSDGCQPTFIRNEHHDRLPLESDSLDLICCFDTLEHIPDMRAIAQEWRRVLRPDGRVWIWWSPWRGPFGHHLESLIPLPWVHLLLSEGTLFAACAELYDDPAFVPRKWDRDPATGQKRPNKWRRTKTFHPFLNRLTRREFEKLIAGAGLMIARRGTYGFSGSRLARTSRILLPVPLLGDCLVSYYVYELTRS